MLPMCALAAIVISVGISLIIKNYCPGNNFPSKNVNATSTIMSLLSMLTEKAPAKEGFYGLALCRGDIQNKEDDCKSCLKDASNSIVVAYPNKAQAIEWYEKCFVNSSQLFFGVVDNGIEPFCGVQQISVDADKTTTELALSHMAMADNRQRIMPFPDDEDMSSWLTLKLLI